MKDILLNKKNQKVFGIAALVTLIVLSSFSYAYFIGSIGGSASTDVDVTTSVNERLVFTEGNPIAINATLDNFSDGDGSLTGETTTNVRLNAGSQSSTATEQYQVYYNIETNNFEYSVNTDTPELILTITDPEGNILTSAKLEDGTVLSSESVTTLVQDEMGATTSQTVTGFDITTIEGIIILSEDYEITNTNPTVATEQNWTAKITFVNLDAEQTINEGKILNSNFMLRQDKVFVLSDQILLNNGGINAIEAKTTPDFSQIANTNEGMYAAPDDYGTSYYFRGAIDNNWVLFADIYWKIIRINGNGSVRLLYTGDQIPTELQKVSRGALLDTIHYAPSSGDAVYAGYMYTLDEQHGILNNSNIKSFVDDWYETNILDKNFDNYVSDSLFCNDRTNTSGSGFGSDPVHFSALSRLLTNYSPILTCPSKNDRFTVSDDLLGNAALTYPIALISGDEISMAGHISTSNDNNFLNGNEYWTMTPFYFTNHLLIGAMSTSSLGQGIAMFNNGTKNDVRPVLSIESTSLATGSGTWNDPYIVL